MNQTVLTPCIKVENVGKCYRIYQNPKDRLKQAFFRGAKKYYKDFWALNDITFEVHRGEALGIIGRNGSGKSTLLQIICGTVTPSHGQVSTHGRLAALLELGSGFNPEFTGIENIYLNGSLLGLGQEEIDARLDDILAFADIGEFVYQPVKTYSSGMVVRLAFAVIANSDPDILVIDEALAVGDAYFTQKCMRFINRFRADRCLLFVSHDCSAVSTVCDRALLLRHGKQVMLGKPKPVTEEYNKELYSVHDQEVASIAPSDLGDRSEILSPNPEDWIDYRADLINASNLPNLLSITQFEESSLTAESFGTGKASIISVRLLDAKTNQPLLIGRGGEKVVLRIHAAAHKEIDQPIVGFLLKNEKGLILLGDNSLNSLNHLLGEKRLPIVSGQNYQADFEFTLPLLPRGSYSFTVSLAEGTQAAHTQLHWMNDALVFESHNTTIAAGLAGVPMHRILLKVF